MKQWSHKYLETPAVWDQDTTGKGVVVAVVDTGIDLKNPDFEGRIEEGGKNFLATSDSYAQLYNGDINNPMDDNGHGTHCAGTIAGANNNTGIVGVAYDAKILPVKVMTYLGGGSSEIIAAGIVYATYKADIISMSIGSNFPDALEEKACKKAELNGKICIASAGNDGRSNLGEVYNYPGSLDSTISVGSLAPGSVKAGDIYSSASELLNTSTRKSDEVIAEITKAFDKYEKRYGASLSDFSQYNDKIDILSPGTAIYSTYILKDDYKNIITKTGQGYASYPTKITSTWEYLNGTSMACPNVSGVVALVLQANPDIKNKGANATSYVRALLQQSSDGEVYYRSDADRERALMGGLNAANAVELAKSGAVNLDITLETPEFTVMFNSDGTAKCGEGSGISINNIDKFPKGTKFIYTLDGSEPDDVNSIEYLPEKTFPADLKSANIKMRARYFNVYSGCAELSVKFQASATEINVLNPNIKLLAGKSTKIETDLYPSNIKNAKLSFKSDNSSITVNRSGAVKAASNAQPGTKAVIEITDTLSGCTAVANVEVVASSNQKIVVPEEYNKGITLSTRQPLNGEVLSLSANLIEKFGRENGSEQFSYKVANRKIAEVWDGVLIPKTSGKTKLIVRTTDGTNKSKSINVVVATPVTEISMVSDTGIDLTRYTLNGFNYSVLPMGSKGCKIKINVTPNADSANKKFTFKIEGDSVSANKIKINNSGVITNGKDAKPGDVFKVTVTSQDGYGAMRTFYVKYYTPITDLKLILGSDNGTKLVSSVTMTERAYQGFVKFGSLYSDKKIDGQYAGYSFRQNENAITTMYKTEDPDGITYLNDPAGNFNPYVITESNSSLLRAYTSGQFCRVIRNQKGKASVTLMVRDGSKKKIKVVVPTKYVKPE